MFETVVRTTRIALIVTAALPFALSAASDARMTPEERSKALKWLEESRKTGLDLVLEIDVQGAAQVREKFPESVAIFILPPSREELERRLRRRGQDSPEEIARRLAKARDEIAAIGEYYDFCVVNDDVERAGREAQAIVNALRCSSPRRRALVEKLLASFGGKD